MIVYFSLIAIFFSSMVYGIIGFGDALVLIPIITPFIGVRNAIVLVNIWGTFPALLNFIKYRKYFDKGYFFRFITIAVPATIIGTFMIITIELEWIELILGLFIFIYSTLRLYQYYKKTDNIELRKYIETKSPIVFLGGFTYGLLTGLISAAGPINVALLEKTGHYRENFIENFAAIGLVLSISRIPFYFVGDIFPFDLIVLFFLAFPIIFIGTKLGQRLTPKIPVKLFQILVFCFLVIIGLKSIITASIGIFGIN